MKKIILLSLFLAMTLQISFAQNQQDELHQEIEQMELQLKKMMEQLQSTMGNSPFLMDTVFIKRFDDLQLEEGQLLPFGGEDLGSMFKLFEDQLQQLDASDFKALEELFDQFQIQPENLDRFRKEAPENDATPKDKKKTKKKRKTYKI